MNAASEIHDVHPYPCKFPASSIVGFLEPAGGTLLDPFCGSGTTIYEAALLGWDNVIGFDCNPIATLISRFKVMRVGKAFFRAAEQALLDFEKRKDALPMSASLDFSGSDHWFSAPVRDDLRKIVPWIRTQRDARIQLWLQVSLSRIINRVSRQDGETRYVAVNKPIRTGETLEYFRDSFELRQQFEIQTFLSSRNGFNGDMKPLLLI